MSYKYKESIKDAVDEVYSPSFADELNRKNELDEVYAKAEAFDEIDEAYANTSTPRIKKYFEAVAVINGFYESGDSE